MTTELFKIKSGQFIGWRIGDNYFSSNGKRAGRFIGDKLYSDDGCQIGWVYPSDNRRIGLRNMYGLSSTGARGTTTESVNFKIPSNLSLNYDSAWTDPEM